MSWLVGITADGPHSSKVSGGRFVNTYKRSFLLKTDEDTTRPTESEVAAALGIYGGSPFENDVNATAGEVQLDALPTRMPHLAYVASVTWSTDAELPANTDPSTANDPTTMRTKWSIKTEAVTEYITRDRNDEIIRNTAGTPPDGGVPVTRYRGCAVAKRNVTASGYDKSAVMKRTGKLNDDTYLGADAGQLQVELESDEVYEGSYHYWAETYTFRFDPNGINPRFASCGFYQLGALDIPVPITFGDLTTPEGADDPARALPATR